MDWITSSLAGASLRYALGHPDSPGVDKSLLHV